MFKNLLKEAFTTDNALHVCLGALIYFPLKWVGVPWLTAVLIVAFILYLREVTQVQAKYFSNKFYRGWLLNRSLHHWMECMFPSLILLVIATVPWAINTFGHLI